jgi:hypothetical protein
LAEILNLGIEKRKLFRSDWGELPDVVIHTSQSAVKRHPLYLQAKQGDAIAAEGLVEDCINGIAVEEIRQSCSSADASFLAVHAVESEGMNAIPRVLARALSRQIGCPVLSGIIQSNRVAHTGASGYHRLAFPALFEGGLRGKNVYLVDDFIGQGGTLANLRGFVELNEGLVIGSTALTGRADSAALCLRSETLLELRSKHGDQLEEWWLAAFGYGFERLTESEARYLIRSDNFDVITEKLAEARRDGNRSEFG